MLYAVYTTQMPLASSKPLGVVGQEWLIVSSRGIRVVMFILHACCSTTRQAFLNGVQHMQLLHHERT